MYSNDFEAIFLCEFSNLERLVYFHVVYVFRATYATSGTNVTMKKPS